MRLALDGQRNTTQSTDIPVVVWMEHIWRSVCSNLSSRVTGSVHLPRPSGAIRPLCRPGWTWRRPWPTPRPGWGGYLPKWHLDAAIAALAALALEHQATPMAGRTHGQHALPMTLGFKLAGWVDELDRGRRRLAERLASSFPASMGGAIGTFAATGPLGPAVQALMAQQLGLLPADMPLRSSYDRASDYLAALGLLAGTAQKIAQDVVFLQRTEVGEVAEAFHIGKVPHRPPTWPIRCCPRSPSSPPRWPRRWHGWRKAWRSTRRQCPATSQ